MLAIALTMLFATAAAAPPARPAGAVGETDPCKVVRVVDGDTVRVIVGGKEEALRLLAIDTEESHNSVAKKITPFGLETSVWAKSFIQEGQPCVLEYGPERRDVYDRLLAYLWLIEDGTWKDYNLQTVEKGYAPYFTKYGYSREHHAEYVAAQKAAQEKKLGVWDPSNEGNLRGTYLGPDGLIAWWNERADALAVFEKDARTRPDIVDTRMHYNLIRDQVDAAKGPLTLTIFTSIRNPDEKSSTWVGKCEGKLGQTLEIVAAGGASETESVLKASVGKYRYFTGTIARKEEGKGLRLAILKAEDVMAAVPPKPGSKETVVKPATAPQATPTASPAKKKKPAKSAT
jgi:endonuclease YncB( thermonuclease family)